MTRLLAELLVFFGLGGLTVTLMFFEDQPMTYVQQIQRIAGALPAAEREHAYTVTRALEDHRWADARHAAQRTRSPRIIELVSAAHEAEGATS